ncbi:MAG: hypothetical protein JW971_09315 [Synergistales bacterium]|nr:hypothetical protein [Synergistales bacterium]
MKKTIITLAVIGVLIVAVAAFAHGDYRGRGYFGRSCTMGGSEYMRGPGYRMGPEDGHMWRSENDGLRRSGAGRHWDQRNNVPSNMVEKMNEMKKLNLQMRMEFLEDEPDRNKLMELHNRIQDLRREMVDRHFREYVEGLGKKTVKAQ